MRTWSFCKMNPDENKHLTRMYWSLRPKSVDDLLEMCGCSGLRPEFFSMLACLCGDAALDAVDFSDFSRSQVQHWRQTFMANHKREKVMCIPAVGCKLVWCAQCVGCEDRASGNRGSAFRRRGDEGAQRSRLCMLVHAEAHTCQSHAHTNIEVLHSHICPTTQLRSWKI